MNERVLLPNGEAFGFWDDQTKYSQVFHVAGGDPNASDENPGTTSRPWRTVSKAAAMLQAGQKAIIHEGIYREFVQPARGGDGCDKMIAYEAAPGEAVILRGSRVWTGPFTASSGYRIDSPANKATVWMGDLTAEWFGTYNPFLVRNACDYFFEFTADWSAAERERLLLRRGMIFADGKPLRQVLMPAELAKGDGAFWVEDPGLRIHFRLQGDADPAKARIEVVVQEQVFAPRERYLGYIRVKGLQFEHAADGIPVPQRAAVSTTRGHHWIIEDCTIRHANATGLDIGAQDWRAGEQDRSGWHIIRRNTVSHCGICGIAGATGVDHTLVEDNLIEFIGTLNLERIWEAAGLKFHTCNGVLIRRNVLRHIKWATGIWLDYLVSNCRISRNILANIGGYSGGIYMEVCQARNRADGNIVWDVHGLENWKTPPALSTPPGINFCTGEYGLADHNFVAKVSNGPGVITSLNQAPRIVQGRVGLCRRHGVYNNWILHCARRVELGRIDENSCDGNIYDSASDQESFHVPYPAPAVRANLQAWQEFFGFDVHGRQIAVQAEFDPDELTLQMKMDGQWPELKAVPQEGAAGDEYPLPGPFTAEQWEILSSGKKLKLPLKAMA